MRYNIIEQALLVSVLWAKYLSFQYIRDSKPIVPTDKNGILIFDIDQTLYYSQDFKRHDNDFKRNDFIKEYIGRSRSKDKDKLKLSGGDEEKSRSKDEDRSKYSGGDDEKVKLSGKKAEEIFLNHTKNGSAAYLLFSEHFNMSPDYFFTKYDQLDYEKFIKKDDQLIEMLKKLSENYEIYAMSNSSSSRCKRILEILRIESYFSLIFCPLVFEENYSTSNPSGFSDSTVIFKPDGNTFDAVLKYINPKEVDRVYFFDDTLANVTEAKKHKIKAYLVDNGTPGNDIKTILSNISEEN